MTTQFKSTDTPTLESTLENIDLENDVDRVRIFVDHPEDDVLVVNDEATVVDEANGTVEYAFSAAQTARAGTHRVEYVIEYTDGSQLSWPPDGYIRLQSTEPLDRDAAVDEITADQDLSVATLYGDQIGTTGDPVPSGYFGTLDTERADITELDSRRRLTNRQDSQSEQYHHVGTSGPFDSLVMNFEDLTWWEDNGELPSGGGADTNHSFRGTQSVRFETGEDNSMYSYGFSEGPVDLTGLIPSIAIKREGPDPDSESLRIGVWDSDDNFTRFRTMLLGGDYRPTDEWFRVDLGPSGDVIDMSNIVDIQIAFTGDSDQTFWIDDLRWIPNRDRGAMIFMFDGTNQSIYDNAYPILDEYGLTATVAVSNNILQGDEGDMSIAQLEELHNAGWEIGAHSNASTFSAGVDGACRGQTDEDMDTVLRESKTNVMDLGLGDVNYLVTLQNGFDGTFLDKVPKYFDLAWGSGHTGSGRSTTTPHATNPWALNRTRTDSTSLIDCVEAFGGVHTSYWHDVTSGGEITPSDFESLVEYAANADIDVINP